MALTLWVAETDVGVLYKDLVDTAKLPLSDYGHSFLMDGRNVPILTGVLLEPGYLGRLKGKFALNRSRRRLWVPAKLRDSKKTAGHFVTAKKVVLTSLEPGGERYESGTRFDIDNHPSPVYAGAGLYFTDQELINVRYHMESPTMHGKPPLTFEQQTGSARIELIGTSDRDVVQRAFATYHSPGMISFDPGTNRPPLLIYERMKN